MRLAAALATLLLIPLATASPMLMPVEGDADVPAATAPVASVQVFLNERYEFTEGARERSFVVPTATWDRVLLTFDSRPDRDPWDRLFGVSIDGVEVLRGTTPRTTFTITKDVTEYAALMAPGEVVPMRVMLGSWVGRGILASVRLDFYDEPLAPAAFDAAHPVALWRGSGAGADLTFADAAPSRVVLEFTTSGHGQAGEFWWMESPPAVANFRILVDGVEVGHATAMPYVYALVGFGTGSVALDAVNTAMWWSAFRATDAAGMHTGVGEVPAYRAEVDAAQLDLFTGARHVEFVQDTGAGSWPASLSVLVDA